MSYRVLTDKDVPMTTRDGVTLRADVYRPDAPGRFPVLQDTRGRFASDGEEYFLPGHRIRVEIASGNFPRFDRLNTGEDQATGTRWQTAQQTIFHDQPARNKSLHSPHTGFTAALHPPHRARRRMRDDPRAFAGQDDGRRPAVAHRLSGRLTGASPAGRGAQRACEGIRGAPRLRRGASERWDVEARPGFPGARTSVGGLGGPCRGPPCIQYRRRTETGR
jgi:hypothetical protein